SSFGALFFFSSRRRHTRWPRDWSSDVCSSDLALEAQEKLARRHTELDAKLAKLAELEQREAAMARTQTDLERRTAELKNGLEQRSEERRVGKECRVAWGP